MPVPVDAELRNLIKRAAARTRLTQAAIMRSALRIGVPQVVKSFEAISNGSMFNITPWSAGELARAYANKKVDEDYSIASDIKGQALPRD